MKRFFLLFFLSCVAFAEIRAIVFDYGGVVGDVHVENVIHFVAQSLGTTTEEAKRILRTCDGDQSLLVERYGLDEQWLEKFDRVVLNACYEMPGALPIIYELKAKGYRVAMLSNVTERAAGYIRRLGFYDHFDPVLLSYELGIDKPDPRIYEKLLEELALPAEEVLFIDDKIENVRGARALGIEAIHYVGPAQFKREMVARKILEEERIELGTHSLWSESVGDPRNQAVLLIAGANCHAHFWSDELANALAHKGYYVIRYDHRDVGLSTPFPESYGVEDLADDAAAILDHFGVKKAHVVGHSMGGYTSQMLALYHPKKVKSLCVVGAGPVGATDDTEKALTPDEMQVLNRTFDLIFSNPPTDDFVESLPHFINVWEHTNGDYPIDVGMVTRYVHEVYFRTVNPITFARHHIEAVEKLMHTMEERRELLSLIKAPTLVVQGGQDPLVLPHRGGIALYKALPHAELKLFPKMGHMLFNRELEKNFIESLQRFLQRVDQET